MIHFTNSMFLFSQEVQKRMEGWRDGRFLVRDSNRHHGEHTLILKYISYVISEASLLLLIVLFEIIRGII